MLSYRHGFHAGNHADVLKHLIFQFVLQYMGEKERPYIVVDTHAGAGAYKLEDEFAQKNKEFETGIGPLWNADRANMPKAVAEYLDVVAKFNKEDGFDDLVLYPGSPWFALNQLPMDGKGFFHELHPTDFDLLRQFIRPNRYRKAIKGDGFELSMGLFPPAQKRGVVIIDPPYEIKDDYDRVVQYVKDVTKRFKGAVILIWYPVVERYRIDKVEQGLKRTGVKNIALYEFNVAKDSHERGMTGSGMILVNQPWKLPSAMAEVLPYLVKTLPGDNNDFRAEQIVPE
ncbi:23S rRNA (adenine(2030)-N(6))-methyltransferase RlmJ [Psychrosphaera sp. 1_MG-2023]|uniref:23S rRNA (adenine(2030)-N(6))-methyltransferase RlmJ n=1 Tax=Psychrosphaera sp. 1_MG-2023 TaxID=3062643 RepID=UPI0026E2571B|nr:23S rRNA (adenine(2030)-N(6))-methyltransferase RlmJ [Psychrosphaera sp. 1_MG-2023]MDO6720698.1 23S rRNA (adenine(2030)-N(6))-methyltransferase RlmJ [Psychrosphaera sp. 1_MG-2023]